MSERHEALLARAHAQSGAEAREHLREGSDEPALARLGQAIERLCRRDEPPRAVDGLTPEREVSVQARSEPTRVSDANLDRGSAPTASRSEAIAAMVEKVEVAMRAGQQTLTLALGEGASAGRVEISRICKGEVAITIQSAGGGRSAIGRQAQALEEGLAARGIRVRKLSIL